MELEYRQINAIGTMYRKDDTPDHEKQEYIDGVGVVYNTKIEVFSGFYETIQAGCFERFLKTNPEIKSMIDHEPARILATTRSTPKLVIEDTPDIVIYHAPIPPTSYGNDLIINLERRNIKGSSFAFVVEKDGAKWEEDEKGNLHRIVTRAQIFELGPVCNPAYIMTKARLRSTEYFIEEARSMLGNKIIGDRVDKIFLRNKNLLNLKRRKLNLISH